MNVFRILVIILSLTLIAGAVVNIRLNNWHYAYEINRMYDQYRRLQRDYWQTRLKLAVYQSPENLLDKLKEFNLPLEGLGLTTTTAPARPAEKIIKPIKPAKKNQKKN
jgi:hypothetical protein